MNLAILSPHLDDAVLSCWQLLEGPDEVMVVNVFTASPPPGTAAPWWDRMTGATDPVQRMDERRHEDAKALRLLGRDSIHLDLLDDQYRRHGLSAHAVADRISAVVGPEVTLLAPGAFDGHVDHAVVRDAALNLAQLGRRVMIYADLPHAIGRGWPDWISGERQPAAIGVAEDWSRELARAGLVSGRLLSSARSVDARARARKLSALAIYRSQRAALDGIGFAPLDDPRALAWEVTWEVPASALGGPPELSSQALLADSAGEPFDDGV